MRLYIWNTLHDACFTMVFAHPATPWFSTLLSAPAFCLIRGYLFGSCLMCSLGLIRLSVAFVQICGTCLQLHTRQLFWCCLDHCFSVCEAAQICCRDHNWWGPQLLLHCLYPLLPSCRGHTSCQLLPTNDWVWQPYCDGQFCVST